MANVYGIDTGGDIPALEARDLSVLYRDQPVIQGISLDGGRGQQASQLAPAEEQVVGPLEVHG